MGVVGVGVVYFVVLEVVVEFVDVMDFYLLWDYFVIVE